MTATCGKGWELRCASSSSSRCRCSCGGVNHGRSPALELFQRNRSQVQLVGEFAGAVILRDVGHDRGYRSVTNDAELVVQDWCGQLHGRRLLYVDSMGELTELVIRDGKFAGFAPVVDFTLDLRGLALEGGHNAK